MRGLTVFAIALALTPAAAALVPAPLVVPWYNGDLDSATLPMPVGGPGYGLPNARIGDLDGNGDNELIVNGHAFGDARWVKSHNPASTKAATTTLLPATAKLAFNVVAPARGDCFLYHDIRVILLGTFDPIPALDTLYNLAPVVPVDYFNDEVLMYSAQFTGQVLRPGPVVLDPLDALMVGGGHPGLSHPFNSFNDDEKRIFLQQHYYLVWVAYAAAYEGGTSNPTTECGFDDFRYLL